MLYDTCNKHRDFLKVMKVLKSCKNNGHIKVAEKMFENFTNLHLVSNKGHLSEEYTDFEDTFTTARMQQALRLGRNV